MVQGNLVSCVHSDIVCHRIIRASLRLIQWVPEWLLSRYTWRWVMDSSLRVVVDVCRVRWRGSQLITAVTGGYILSCRLDCLHVARPQDITTTIATQVGRDRRTVGYLTREFPRSAAWNPMVWWQILGVALGNHAVENFSIAVCRIMKRCERNERGWFVQCCSYYLCWILI